LRIGFVFGEEEFVGTGTIKDVITKLPVLGNNGAQIGILESKLGGHEERGAAIVASPRPGIAKPERGKNVDGGNFRATIRDIDADQNIFRCDLGILDDDIEIAALLEDAGVYQLEFPLESVASAVFFQELFVGIRGMRIFIEILHVGVRRSAVEVEVIFFDVLAVVTFAAREAEDALLQDWVFLVPQRKGKADALVTVANAGDSFFVPAVRFGASGIVGDEVPVIVPQARSLTYGPHRFQCDLRSRLSSSRLCSAVLGMRGSMCSPR